MIKITCDMCGKEIKKFADLCTLDFSPEALKEFAERKIELCIACSTRAYNLVSDMCIKEKERCDENADD